MNIEHEKIVVTGAAGWLGLGLINALLNGIDSLPTLKHPTKLRVLVCPDDDVSLLEQYERTNRLEILKGDVRSKADCAKLMANMNGALLYHTAGIIHPKKVKDLFEVNVEGTRNILASAEIEGLKRAVIVSSNSPIGCNPTNDHLFDENSPYNPYMNYGKSKMMMEEVVKGFQRRGNLETVTIRAPWFYGPFQPLRQSLFFQMVRDGKAPIVGNGNNMRSMVYIDNLVQGLVLAGNTLEANGKTYWIADKYPYSMNKIIDTIENVLEQDFHIICKHGRMKLPSIFSDIAYYVDKSIQSFGFYHQKFHVLSEMNKTIACSVELAEKELGYKPSIELQEGMKRSIKWCIQSGVDI